MLEMIEILKVKREFLYLLLTLTQEKNVKVSRFPLIHLDETILAHTNLAEFNKFLQEKENEALLDRMVIIKVPYALSYNDEARIYQKLVSGAPAFRHVHLDPHVLKLAAVFAILTRLAKPEREGLDVAKKLRIYAGESIEGFAETEVTHLKAESPDEGLSGREPALRGQCHFQCHHPQRRQEPHEHGTAAGAQGFHRQRCAHGCQAEETVDGSSGPRAQGVLQPLGQGGRPSFHVRLLRAGSAAAARESTSTRSRPRSISAR